MTILMEITQVQSAWETAFVTAFVTSFSDLLEFYIEPQELEVAVLQSRINNEALCNLNIALLRLVNYNTKKEKIDVESWTNYLQTLTKSAEFKEYMDIPSFQEYDDLEPLQKVMLLKSICDYLLQQDICRETLKERERSKDLIRAKPLGTDHQGNLYWHFGNHARVYKETLPSWANATSKKNNFFKIGSKSANAEVDGEDFSDEIKWEVVSSTVDELISFQETLQSSKFFAEKQLCERVKLLIPKILEYIEVWPVITLACSPLWKSHCPP
ncbi:hypothetical protein BKA69DRAFT_258741 [Paraphysoderma sedebokerense]|nr:hypothetical protein BKA69DRAFT_258741 [Paraphysoderma sedebokerense]